MYQIGQIMKIKAMEHPPQVVVRLYGHLDDVTHKMQRRELFVPLASDEVR